MYLCEETKNTLRVVVLYFQFYKITNNVRIVDLFTHHVSSTSHQYTTYLPI